MEYYRLQKINNREPILNKKAFTFFSHSVILCTESEVNHEHNKYISARL